MPKLWGNFTRNELNRKSMQKCLSRFIARSVAHLTARLASSTAPGWRAQGDSYARYLLIAGKAHPRLSTVVIAIAAVIACGDAGVQAIGQDTVPIKSRNLDVLREEATQLPRGEEDQAVVDGWPLYRTRRGQEAFNDA